MSTPPITYFDDLYKFYEPIDDYFGYPNDSFTEGDMQALSGFMRSEEQPLFMITKNDEGIKAFQEKNYSKAISDFKEHLNDVSNPQERAQIFNNIASCYEKISGCEKETCEYFEEAMKLSEDEENKLLKRYYELKINRVEKLSSFCLNIINYIQNKEYYLAIYELKLNFSKDLDTTTLNIEEYKVWHLLHLAICYYYLNNTQKTQAYISEAIPLTHTYNSKIMLSSYLERIFHDEHINALEAQKLLQDETTNQQVAHSKNQLGEHCLEWILLWDRKIDETNKQVILGLVNQKFCIAQRFLDPSSLESYELFTKITLAYGNFLLKCGHFQDALSCYLYVLNNFSQLQSTDFGILFKLYYELGFCYLKLDQFNNAAYYFQAIDNFYFNNLHINTDSETLKKLTNKYYYLVNYQIAEYKKAKREFASAAQAFNRIILITTLSFDIKLKTLKHLINVCSKGNDIKSFREGCCSLITLSESVGALVLLEKKLQESIKDYGLFYKQGWSKVIEEVQTLLKIRKATCINKTLSQYKNI